MDKNAIRDFIYERISDKLILFNLDKAEVDKDFDLVKSGLLDSMAFVDLVAALEEKFKVEIDFEQAAENDDFTRLGNLIILIKNARNAK